MKNKALLLCVAVASIAIGYTIYFSVSKRYNATVSIETTPDDKGIFATVSDSNREPSHDVGREKCDDRVSTVANAESKQVASQASNAVARKILRAARPMMPQDIARLERAQTISDSLTLQEMQPLIVLLNTPLDEGQEPRALYYNGLKNNLLDKLIQQENPPLGLGYDLVDMYRDRRHDVVWRDYCVQHFAMYYEEVLAGREDQRSVRESRAIQSAYWEAVRETDSTIAGTALLGLERLSKKYSEFDRDRLGQVVVQLAGNEGTPDVARITAMRLCAETEQKAVLPSARYCARQHDCIPLQLASISVLGELGDPSDRALLDSIRGRYAGGPVMTAVERALEQIETQKE